MTAGTRWRIGMQAALVLGLAATIIPCGLLLHATWWRTATSVSHRLLDALEGQIAAGARRAWWSEVLEVQAISATLAEALAAAPDPEDRERVLAEASAASASASWLVFVPDDPAAGASGVAAGLRVGVGGTDLLRFGPDGQVTLARRMAAGDDDLVPAADAPTSLQVWSEDWLAVARAAADAQWTRLRATPPGGPEGVVYVQRVAPGEPQGGVLAAMLDFGQFARLLGGIPVGRTGRSYVVGPDGAIVLAGDAQAAPRLAALDPVALAAGAVVAARPKGKLNIEEAVTLEVGGERYGVGLSPLWFNGWQLAVIIPEAEFLGEIDRAIARAGLGLAFFVILAGGIGAVAVRLLVARPVALIAEDLGHIERFELETVPRRPSRLREIDRLSEALVRMSAGLSDFGKYIPADLVRGLLVEGMRAEPGGAKRDITIMFSDLAGFTALSERLGDAVVPLIGRCLDIAAREVSAHGGTVDKFIGDSVMAFWGAPKDDPDHVLNGCRAVLAAARAFRAFRDSEADAAGLGMRFGLNSGTAIVGNVGSSTRLNYTALGDSVNLASRLEGVNKVYGTDVLIGENVWQAAGEAIVTREVDAVAVYGRAQGERIFELLGLAAEGPAPGWVAVYEAALAAYRGRDFTGALAQLDRLAALKPGDGPGERLAARCRELLAAPPPADWSPVTVLGMK